MGVEQFYRGVDDASALRVPLVRVRRSPTAPGCRLTRASRYHGPRVILTGRIVKLTLCKSIDRKVPHMSSFDVANADIIADVSLIGRVHPKNHSTGDLVPGLHNDLSFLWAMVDTETENVRR